MDVNTPYASPNYQHLSATPPLFVLLTLIYPFHSLILLYNNISVILLQNSAITKVMQQLGVNKTPHSFFSIASHTFSLCASNLVSISKSFQTTTFHYPLLRHPSYSLPTPWTGLRVKKTKAKCESFNLVCKSYHTL